MGTEALDLTGYRGSAAAIKLMEAIRDQSGVFRVFCRDEAQVELVDRAAVRAREREITAATVVTEVHR